jgi:uncharacterized protein (DUF433 family)
LIIKEEWLCAFDVIAFPYLEAKDIDRALAYAAVVRTGSAWHD